MQAHRAREQRPRPRLDTCAIVAVCAIMGVRAMWAWAGRGRGREGWCRFTVMPDAALTPTTLIDGESWSRATESAPRVGSTRCMLGPPPVHRGRRHVFHRLAAERGPTAAPADCPPRPGVSLVGWQMEWDESGHDGRPMACPLPPWRRLPSAATTRPVVPALGHRGSATASPRAVRRRPSSRRWRRPQEARA